MIQGVQIHKKFNSLNVLNGINISINQKEIVSIVGKSGAVYNQNLDTTSLFFAYKRIRIVKMVIP